MGPSIPLPLLLAVISGGTALVLGLVYRFGGAEVARIADLPTAISRFGVSYPAVPVTDGVLADDHAAAFLWTPAGMGVVAVLGDRLVTRVWKPGAIQSVYAEPSRLCVYLADPTFAALVFPLTDTVQRSIWMARLSTLVDGAK